MLSDTDERPLSTINCLLTIIIDAFSGSCVKKRSLVIRNAGPLINRKGFQGPPVVPRTINRSTKNFQLRRCSSCCHWHHQLASCILDLLSALISKSKMSECEMQGGKRTLLVKYLPWSPWSGGDLTTPSLKAESIGLLRYYDLGILT